MLQMTAQTDLPLFGSLSPLHGSGVILGGVEFQINATLDNAGIADPQQLHALCRLLVADVGNPCDISTGVIEARHKAGSNRI